MAWKESCEGVDGCQVFCTCKTMLALPGTRQMIINQAFYKRGSSKNPCCPKLQQYVCVQINNKQLPMAAN